MTTFVEFRDTVNQKIVNMTVNSTPVFRVALDEEALYNLYLDSFPEGTNKIFRERREYDCTCCRRFIRDVGALVTLDAELNLVSIWDIQVGGYYQPVVNAMAAFVKQHAIADSYLHIQREVGELSNFEIKDGKQKEWNHFHTKLHPRLVKGGELIPSTLGEWRTNFEMLERSLREISLDSANIVMELIDQNSLYKGAEKRNVVNNFIKAKREYDALPEEKRVNHCWLVSQELGKGGRFRGDVIGTLLEDLSEGVDLEVAVKKFEDKVSGTNYQRPTALVTPAMVKKAQEKVVELGMVDSLERRFAVAGDLTINNVLFADRSIKPAMKNAFDVLAKESAKPVQSLDKVEKISIADFIVNVLPKAGSLEMLFTPKLKANLVSLIAPVHESAPNLFQWDNPFSWSYNGEVADAIKERVKAAGGNVEGELRVSLAWHNADDLDLHIHEPKGGHIYFSRNARHSAVSGGLLDVDMNGLDGRDDVNPVENVTWAKESRMAEGVYTVVVNQYSVRSTDRPGFTVQMEYKGQVFTFEHPARVKGGDNVIVLKFKYSKANGVEIIESMGHSESAQKASEAWGIHTNSFHPVKMMMFSPNHWDGEQTGHKHYFFMLDGCQNPDPARGFYNEFLKPELKEHRKVFELLAGKMKAEPTPDQLSGLGFSSTVANSVHVKVGGAFNRVLEVMF